MKIELANPFIVAAFSVLESVVGETPEKGTPQILDLPPEHHDMNISIGVTGDVQGNIVFGMSTQTAINIASTMIGSPIAELDAFSASALGELVNMIAGNGLMHLSSRGLVCDVTPPTVIRGTRVEICTISVEAMAIPILLEIGEITMTVGLVQAK